MATLESLSPSQQYDLTEEVRIKRDMWLADYVKRKNYIADMRKQIKGDAAYIELKDSEGRTRDKVKIRYAFRILEQMSQFMGNNIPMVNMHVPPTYAIDPSVIFSCQAQENFIRTWMKEIEFGSEYAMGGKTASWFGGAAYRLYDVQGIAKFEAIERPENLILCYKQDDFSELEAYIYEYSMSPYAVKRKWDIDIDPEAEVSAKPKHTQSEIPEYASSWTRAGRQTTGSYNLQSPVKYSDTPKGFVNIQRYEDDEKELTVVKGHLVEYKEKNYGFVPLYIFRNIVIPGEPWGVSDYYAAEDLEKLVLGYLDKENTAVNENMMKTYTTNSMKLKKEDLQMDEQTRSRLIRLNSTLGETFTDATSSSKIDTTQISGERELLELMMNNMSFSPQQMLSATDANSTTGKGIRMAFSSVIGLVKSKQQQMSPLLDRMIQDAVGIMVDRGPKSVKGLFPQGITGTINFEFGDVLEEDITANTSAYVAQQNAGVLSKYTTRKKLGVHDPNFEEFMIGVEKAQDVQSQQPQPGQGGQPQPGQEQPQPGQRVATASSPASIGAGMASSKGFTGGAGSISPAGQNRQVAQHTAEQAAAGGQ